LAPLVRLGEHDRIRPAELLVRLACCSSRRAAAGALCGGHLVRVRVRVTVTVRGWLRVRLRLRLRVGVGVRVGVRRCAAATISIRASSVATGPT